MPSHARRWLIFGGCLSLAIALLHIGVIVGGAPAYRYFGAGEKMAQMAAAGRIWPAALTSLITLVFALWGSYAFSGAGLIRRLPFLRLGLVVISAVFILRGLAALPQAYWLLSGSHPAELRDFVFSLVALTAGVSYAIGAILNWRGLKRTR